MWKDVVHLILLFALSGAIRFLDGAVEGQVSIKVKLFMLRALRLHSTEGHGLTPLSAEDSFYFVLYAFFHFSQSYELRQSRRELTLASLRGFSL